MTRMPVSVEIRGLPRSGTHYAATLLERHGLTVQNDDWTEWGPHDLVRAIGPPDPPTQVAVLKHPQAWMLSLWRWQHGPTPTPGSVRLEAHRWVHWTQLALALPRYDTPCLILRYEDLLALDPDAKTRPVQDPDQWTDDRDELRDQVGPATYYLDQLWIEDLVYPSQMASALRAHQHLLDVVGYELEHPPSRQMGR